MDRKIRKLTDIVADEAYKIGLPVEDLAVMLGEATSNNCPEIFHELQKYYKEQDWFQSP